MILKRFVIPALALVSAWAFGFETEQRFLEIEDGKRLSAIYQSHEGPKGPLLILPGRTEPAAKHTELLQEFSGRGFGPIWLTDHRGQGRSARLLEDPEKGHIQDFQIYIDDVGRWLDRAKVPASIIAHSMGGAIALGAAARFPEKVRAVAASAPMIRIRLPFPSALAYGLAWVMVKLGYGEDYVFGGGPQDLSQEKFETNRVSQDEKRWKKSWQMRQDDPGLRTGAPTFQWIYQALRYEKWLKQQAPSIRTPALFLIAGNDELVDAKAEEAFCQAMPVCRIEPFPQAKHEIFSEIDEIRAPAIEAVSTFLSYRRGAVF